MRTTFSISIKSLYLSIFVAAMGCTKLNVPEATPGCIKSKIREIKSNKVANPPRSVWKYDFNGQTVYYITQDCCDQFNELYDEDCNLLCYPDGGFTGGGDGKCSNFFSDRTNEVLIWKDDRK